MEAPLDWLKNIPIDLFEDKGNDKTNLVSKTLLAPNTIYVLSRNCIETQIRHCCKYQLRHATKIYMHKWTHILLCVYINIVFQILLNTNCTFEYKFPLIKENMARYGPLNNAFSMSFKVIDVLTWLTTVARF